MKHRHSFFVDTRDNQPDAFELVKGDSETHAVLHVQHLQAAREWKVTIDIEDLDPNLRVELKKGRLTAQFVGKTGCDVPEPLQRGFVQGLHLFWPGNADVESLPLVGSILDSSTSKAIQLPTSLSYVHIPTLPQPILDTLFERLWTLLQPTDALLLAPLAKASVLEIDVLPSTLQVRAIWASAPHPDGWRLDIPSVPGTRTEIGIFQEESGEDKDEYAIGGVRAILGQDREFTPTLFTFPHRHHILSSAPVVTRLEPVYGSHPNIRTLLPSVTLVPPMNDTVDHESCTLHSLYTLSKEVFVDKYQLAQLAQFHSGGIADVRGVWGETDLEDPTYKTEAWGSVVLLDLAVPAAEEELVLELPVHLRYLEPSLEGGYEALTLLPPQLFWTCQNSVEGTAPDDGLVADLDFSVSPFGPPSSSLLHTLFPNTAVFYHLPHHSVSEGALTMNVPVGNVSQVDFVQGLTALGILGGFTYLFVKGVRLGLKGLRWRGKGKEKAKDI